MGLANTNKFNVTINEENLESRSQNVQFSDQTPLWDYVVDSMPDDTYRTADMDDATLDNFFSRPLKVASYSWGTGTNLFEQLDPWQLYFENPRVINRITNYHLLRCKLKVRFMLNGNGFHYGRAIASYNPLHTIDEVTQDRSYFIQDVVAASQRPHVYLDPTTSQGGTLTLPFFWYKNALSIPSQEWRNMGDIHIHGMQNLKHANGATDQVTISVFVWAEDVSLSIPTADEPGALSPQMGEIFKPQAMDEYGTGPVSRPAGFIAKVAGALSSIAPIAPYAKATQLAASTVSSVATMFGFSRPVVLADIQPYKPTLVGNWANTNMPDSSTKLTLDAKQELTIDPRVMGLGSADEMAFKAIATRESFLTNFGWEVAATTESLLWNSEVCPVIWTMLNDEIHMPACCFATLPFKRWRGSMKFRFQIVASAYHKGRLKIVYDPSYPLTNEYNTNYTYIIDLAKERDFTVEVGWGQTRSMHNHRTPGFAPVIYSDTKLSASPNTNGNGIISVYVVNELTVPNSTINNNVEVNVFVSAGDDMEVFEPDTEEIKNYSYYPQPSPPELFRPQMAEESQPDSDLTKNEDSPMKLEASSQMAAPLSDADHTICVYYGDPITSFRQVLKRFDYHSDWVKGSSDTTNYRITNSNFPFYRGYTSSGINTDAAGNNYNFSRFTLLNYLAPAFEGYRGGLRWKYVRVGGDTDETSLMYLVRHTPSAPVAISETSAGLISDSSVDQRTRELANFFPGTITGAAATSTRQNPTLEVELPFYTNVRFFPTKRVNITGSNVSFSDRHRLYTQWDAQGNDSAYIASFVSIGEDFTFGFFTGAPVMYRYSDPEGLPSP